MNIPRHYENLAVLHENTEPSRCYYIPDAVRNDQIVNLRESSQRMVMLSGCEWNFAYYPSIYDLQDEFWLPSYTAGEWWNSEYVPFCWQMRGYDHHQYTNIRYPFPFDPPYVPQNNPCGAYRHHFSWHRDHRAGCTFLNFEGVDSCFYVWLNGKYVGYSQVSHHTAEFDVTSFLEEGDNLLAVLVLKWCDGSYLEDQDKFRMSGIFRDVYLLNRPSGCIRDYKITTDITDDLQTAEIRAELFYSNDHPLPVTAVLLHTDENGEEHTDGEIRVYGESEICFRVENPVLWNAESPFLYRLILETSHEVINERVGIRSVSVRGSQVILNGRPIKFNGVNRHESDPVYGAAADYMRTLEDLKIIKENNFNAVRASHYPDVPYFYQLCDSIGLYVIDEADIESHGAAALYFNEDDYSERMKLSHERIADNPCFDESVMDRVRSMVLRNRNRPCILVWSMGNESGYGCNFEKALKWTKDTDPGRLTHYESAFYLPEIRSYDVSRIDIFGRMYPSFSEIQEYMENGPDKPLLLVEYCHSMGNGPGDIEDYFELIQKYPALCGGFVWEFCDHAVYQGKTDDGRDIYIYGGDSGELQHDGNFCLDGLVYPDRRPHTGLLEYRNVYRPLRSSYDAEHGILTITNHTDFTDPFDTISASYELILDGTVIAEGALQIPHIQPSERIKTKLLLTVPEKGRCFLKITYALKKACGILRAGLELGFDEIRIPTQDPAHARVRSLRKHMTAAVPGPLTVNCSAGGGSPHIIIHGQHFEYAFDRRSGMPVSLIYGDRELLDRPAGFNLWRAPTDNDRPLADLWKWERLGHISTRAYRIRHEVSENRVVIRARQSAGAQSVQPLIRMDTVWEISSSGAVTIRVEADKDPHLRSLPRIGIRLFLKKWLRHISYYGMGPVESYIDKHRAASHGTYSANLPDMHEPYIRPQENGSHFDCDYVSVSGKGMCVHVIPADDSTFSFNASCYTQEELENRNHDHELEPCGSTVLCIDHRMAGIGSASCGPELSAKYRIEDPHYSFAFMIIPEECPCSRNSRKQAATEY